MNQLIRCQSFCCYSYNTIKEIFLANFFVFHFNSVPIMIHCLNCHLTCGKVFIPILGPWKSMSPESPDNLFDFHIDFNPEIAKWYVVKYLFILMRVVKKLKSIRHIYFCIGPSIALYHVDSINYAFLISM